MGVYSRRLDSMVTRERLPAESAVENLLSCGACTRDGAPYARGTWSGAICSGDKSQLAFSCLTMQRLMNGQAVEKVVVRDFFTEATLSKSNRST